jgi:hypothetical protein
MRAAAEEAARTHRDEVFLRYGGTRAPPSACAHLTSLVPRVRHPPPGAFVKFPKEAAVFGAPRKVIINGLPLSQYLRESATRGVGLVAAALQGGDAEGAAAAAAAEAKAAAAEAAAEAAASAGFTLHDYQVEGLNWLLFNYFQGRGGASLLGLLADCRCAAAAAVDLLRPLWTLLLVWI